MHLEPLGDSALIARDFGHDRQGGIAVIVEALRQSAPTMVTDVVGAFDSIAILYDVTRCEPNTDPVGALRSWVMGVVESSEHESPDIEPRRIEIRVHYGGEFGPDLPMLADRLKLAPAEIVRLHRSVGYRVLAVGFMPGFGYLGGLPKALHTTRRSSPRTLVPAGSVGIGGPYTGVYPFASPGGWNLIGRAVLPMFDPSREEAALLRVGDVVQFTPVEGNGS